MTGDHLPCKQKILHGLAVLILLSAFVGCQGAREPGTVAPADPSNPAPGSPLPLPDLTPAEPYPFPMIADDRPVSNLGSLNLGSLQREIAGHIDMVGVQVHLGLG